MYICIYVYIYIYVYAVDTHYKSPLRDVSTNVPIVSLFSSRFFAVQPRPPRFARFAAGAMAEIFQPHPRSACRPSEKFGVIWGL